LEVFKFKTMTGTSVGFQQPEIQGSTVNSPQYGRCCFADTVMGRRRRSAAAVGMLMVVIIVIVSSNVDLCKL
jgi:hypothetical protein